MQKILGFLIILFGVALAINQAKAESLMCDEAMIAAIQTQQYPQVVQAAAKISTLAALNEKMKGALSQMTQNEQAVAVKLQSVVLLQMAQFGQCQSAALYNAK